MATKLNKVLKREIEVDGKPYMVALSPEGVKLTEKGKRLGRELTWKELVGGSDAARLPALPVRTPAGPEQTLESRVNQESLRELLARVHERLSAATSVDGESRQLLGTLMHDIERALGAVARAAAPPASVAASRLEGLAVRIRGRSSAAGGGAAAAHRRARQGRNLGLWCIG